MEMNGACIDRHSFGEDAFPMVAINDACAKLAGLSEERARRVVELIDDLAELEAIENAQDLAAARDALADGELPVPWEEAKARLDAVHGLD
jgi:hypothetical protein